MSEDLQNLFKALTGSEKRFVRRQIRADVNSARARLLNLFWDWKEVPEEKIRIAIGGKTGMHQPHVICHQLFKSILDALRKFHSDQEEYSLQNGVLYRWATKSNSSQPPIYPFGMGGGGYDMKAEQAAQPSIEPGSQDVIINVSLTYEIE